MYRMWCLQLLCPSKLPLTQYFKNYKILSKNYKLNSKDKKQPINDKTLIKESESYGNNLEYSIHYQTNNAQNHNVISKLSVITDETRK